MSLGLTNFYPTFDNKPALIKKKAKNKHSRYCELQTRFPSLAVYLLFKDELSSEPAPPSHQSDLRLNLFFSASQFPSNQLPLYPATYLIIWIKFAIFPLFVGIVCILVFIIHHLVEIICRPVWQKKLKAWCFQIFFQLRSLPGQIYSRNKTKYVLISFDLPQDTIFSLKNVVSQYLILQSTLDTLH